MLSELSFLMSDFCFPVTLSEQGRLPMLYLPLLCGEPLC